MSLGVFTPLTEAQHSGRVWILKSFLVCCVQCYLWSEFIKRSMITLEGENPSSCIPGGCFFFWHFFLLWESWAWIYYSMCSSQQTLWKSSHMYPVLLHSGLSAGLTKIHFSRSILFPCYIFDSQYIDLLILCFKTCIHWEMHWVFSITHCSALLMRRQWHCSGIYSAFWLKLGKYIFCSHLLSMSAVALVKPLFQALAQFCYL